VRKSKKSNLSKRHPGRISYGCAVVFVSIFLFFFFLIYFDFLDLDWLQMLASPSSKGLHWVVGKDLT
jgi:hypothetical protein